MKKFSAKKYFLYAIPSTIIYRLVSFFTIDKYLEGAVMIDFAIIIAILLLCLYLSKNKNAK